MYNYWCEMSGNGNVKLECPRCGQVNTVSEDTEDVILDKGQVVRSIGDFDIIKVVTPIDLCCLKCEVRINSVVSECTQDALSDYDKGNRT